jgi:CarD family transcriptional regulator
MKEEDTITELADDHVDEDESVAAEDHTDGPEDGEQEIDLDELEVLPQLNFEIGDSVVYPQHGAGQVLKKEDKTVLGETREYLTIQILHNEMTVMVPTENASRAGLRRVIDEQTVEKVVGVLQSDCSKMPGNWSRRYKYNREKIRSGDIYDLAEVVRDLGVREHEKGLSTGEKGMYNRAKRILASEMMYALNMDEEQVDEHLTTVILDGQRAA